MDRFVGVFGGVGGQELLDFHSVRDVAWRLAVGVFDIGFGAVFEQEVYCFGMPVPRRVVERCPLLEVRDVRVTSALEQDLDNLDVSPNGGIVETGAAVVILEDTHETCERYCGILWSL